MNTNISIIIPTLNEQANIGDCIDSALAIDPWEVIVADGGSTDRTLEIASARNVQVITSEAGRAVQQNAGAAESTGNVLLFLHADCRLPGDAGDQIRSVAKKQSHFTGAFRQRINADGFLYRILEIGNALRVRILATPYGDQGIFLSRELFESVGRFPDLPIMEDLQLMRDLSRWVRPHLLAGPLQVDARRWQRNGVVRQTLRNWSLVLAWARGTPASELVRHYPTCNDPKQPESEPEFVGASSGE